MKALVTGGLGFIGRCLVKKLLIEGHQVKVIDNMEKNQSVSLNDTNLDVIFKDIMECLHETGFAHFIVTFNESYTDRYELYGSLLNSAVVPDG